MLKNYYDLTKPGIVYGNVFTTLAAFLFASRWHFGWGLFFATMIGIACVIASACVFNNYIDRDIDEKMQRTKDRALVSGAISSPSALRFGIILALLGFIFLLIFVNTLTAFAALIGFLVYVFAYTFSKRVTPWATEIGSIAGAMPIVVGYTAVTDRLDAAALILFLALAFWQMPHFYAIALFRREEYAAAGVPVLPITNGIWETELRMLLYIIAFGAAAFALNYFGYAGYAYLVIVEATALVWFALATEGFRREDTEVWARKLFFTSLIALVVFSVMLSLASILP
jgi:protoheme IX farnesyltransferase